MSDGFFLVVTIGFAALTWGLVVLCRRLLGDQP
jgi:hypothetical protein